MTSPTSHTAPAQGENAAPALDAAGADAAASVLEQLIIDSGHSSDRARIRRVIREASDAFPGEPEQLWWRWIAEAGANLGWKCKIADCTPDELFELARDGLQLVFYVPGTDPWRAVTAVRGRRFRVARGLSLQPSRWCSLVQLNQFVGNPGMRDMVRCVIVEQSVTCVDAVPGRTQPMSPLERFWALLKPEHSDLFVLLVFALIVGLLTLAVPIATQSLINTVAFGRFLQPVVVLTVLLLAFLAFSAAIQTLESFVVEVIQCRLFARVAADLAYRLPRIRFEACDGRYMPELANRFFDIVTLQKVTSKLLLGGLTLVLNAVVGMVVLAFYHPWLLGFDLVLLALLAIVVFVVGRGAVATSIRESQHKYATAAWFQDLARCAVTFKYDGGAELALERADQVVFDYLAARRKHFRVLLRQILFSLSTQAVASAALLGIGGWLVMTGQLTLGQLVAAELIVAVIVGSFAKLGGYMESFYDVLAAVDKLGMLLDLPMEEQEGILHRFPAQPSTLTARGVEFSFGEGPAVLESVRLEIGSGERVALTGAGKSVLFDLIFGLRSPTYGHLALDGIDPRDLRPDFLRRRVALVRGVEVFEGTVAESVHLARPEITFNEVRDALEQAGLLEGVLRLPKGIDTELTSGGSPLSDTQLRRDCC
jgi:putative ABC transport system ATP-binding protein